MAFSIRGEMVMAIWLGLYFIMNIIGLFIMGADKKRAQKHQYRISERSLWMVAILGGAVGTTAGMQLYRHKTKHTSFKVGFPVLAVIELVLFIKFLI
jgi:uncharacterized membrane protein YsdA (DUF1294 family)